MANVQRVGGQTGGFPSGYNNDDNTGRNMTYDYQAPAYATTQAIITNAGSTEMLMALTGNCTITISVGTSTTAPYIGDTLEILFTPDSSTRTVTFSTGFAGNGTLAVTGTKYGVIDFTFNGTIWVETGRNITA